MAEVRVATYNVLSPKLCSAAWFPACPTSASTKPGPRLALVRAKLKEEMARGSVVCLQEVSREWYCELLRDFTARDYVYLHSEYGSLFNGYMGVGVAFPKARFELEGSSIVRVSDTKPGGYSKRADEPAAPVSWVSWLVGLSKTALGLVGLGWAVPKALLGMEEGGVDYWADIERRKNTLVAVKLRTREAEGGAAASSSKGGLVWVGTYHMPCAFRQLPTMGVHASLVAKRMRKLAGNLPFVLAGDFNIKPPDACYELLTTGSLSTPARRAEIVPPTGAFDGDPPFKLELQHPMQSAYKVALGREPEYTNYALNKHMDDPFIDTLDYIFFRSGDPGTGGGKLTVKEVDPLPARSALAEAGIRSYPTPDEPSDHLKLGATFALEHQK